MGGFYDWRSGLVRVEQPLYERAKDLVREASAKDNIRIFTASPVTGVWGDNQVTAVRTGGDKDDFDHQYIEVRAGSVIVATGCIERPLIFENNERPGVMQAGCALAPGPDLWAAAGKKSCLRRGRRSGPGSGR